MPTSADALATMLALLPGSLGIIFFELIATKRKRDVIVRVTGALAFTLIGHLGADAALTLLQSIPSLKIAALVSVWWPEKLAVVTAISAISGLVLGVLESRGVLYWVLEKLKLTKRTGAADVWSQMLLRGDGFWVEVVFKDGKRLVGWPEYFSEEPDNRQIFLAKACWHYPNSPANRAISCADAIGSSGKKFLKEDVPGRGVLIVSFTDIVAINFLD